MQFGYSPVVDDAHARAADFGQLHERLGGLPRVEEVALARSVFAVADPALRVVACVGTIGQSRDRRFAMRGEPRRHGGDATKRADGRVRRRRTSHVVASPVPADDPSRRRGRAATQPATAAERRAPRPGYESPARLCDPRISAPSPTSRGRRPGRGGRPPRGTPPASSRPATSRRRRTSASRPAGADVSAGRLTSASRPAGISACGPRRTSASRPTPRRVVPTTPAPREHRLEQHGPHPRGEVLVVARDGGTAVAGRLCRVPGTRRALALAASRS